MAAATRKRRTLQQGLDGLIGRQVQEVRDLQRPRMSQQQLANKLGVTQATVTRMESGDRAITVAEVFQIAAVLDVAPIYLFTGAFGREKVPITSKIKLSVREAEEWVTGKRLLPGGDEVAWHRNVPDDMILDLDETERRIEAFKRRFPPGAKFVVADYQEHESAAGTVSIRFDEEES